MSKTVTVRQVAEAMVADKTPKAKGMFELKFGKYDHTEGFVAACAIGGAAWRLGVDAWQLQSALGRVNIDGVPQPKRDPLDEPVRDLAAAIYIRNDNTRISKKQIGNVILKHADEKTLNTELNVAEWDEGEHANTTFIGKERK